MEQMVKRKLPDSCVVWWHLDQVICVVESEDHAFYLTYLEHDDNVA